MTRHPRAVGLALTAVAAFLLLWRLGTPLLWQDEAETANVALGVLESGYPTPLLGETEPGTGHLVTQQAGRDAVRIGERVLWSWHPWPQHYLAAAGMALFGRGTWQARLPFALIALACVPLFYAWRLRRDDDTAFAAVATAVFAFSPAFYLFARQCRYYPLLFLGGLWAVWSYDRLREETAGRSWLGLGLALAGALALVFYANPLTGVALAAGFAVHAAWRWRRGRLRRPGAILAALVLFALLAAPWLALVAVSDVRAPALGLAGRLAILVSQVWRIQYVLLPAVLWPVLAWWLLRSRKEEEWPDETDRSLRDDVVLLTVLLAVSWLVVSLQAPLGTARYVLPLWPLAAVAVAAVWRLLHRRSKVAGGLFLAAVLLTDLLPSLPAAPVAWARPGRTVYDREAGGLDKLAHQGRVGLTLPRELAGLAERRCGPVAALVGVGRQLRRPPRAIVADYAQESLFFYLGGSARMPAQAAARERLGLAPARLGTEGDRFGRVDLVIPRRGWPSATGPVLAAGGFVPVATGVPDHAYENLPDPTGHRWGPAEDSPAWRPLPELVAWVRPELVPEGGFGPLAAPGCTPFPAPTVVASPPSTNHPEPPS